MLNFDNIIFKPALLIDGTEMKITVFTYTSVGFLPAGEFERTETHTLQSVQFEGRFTYFDDYLQSAHATPIDPISIPLKKTSFTTDLNNGFFGVIRDSMPDYWGRTVLEQFNSSNNEFDILTLSKADRIGHLDFRASKTSLAAPHQTPTPNDLSCIIDSFNQIYESKKLDPQISSLLLSGTTIGGARPKINLEIDGQLWLAKLPAKQDLLSNAKIEYTMLQTAKAIGIPTPDIETIDCHGQDILLLKRFDRDGVTRSGMMSGLSLLNADERDYFLDYVDVSHQLASLNRVDDARQLFKRIVLNGMISNTDDHARNHAFLFDGFSIQLSPVYDLSPTLRKRGVSSTTYHALKITSNSEASLSNYLANCERFFLSRKEAKDIFEEVANSVEKIPILLKNQGFSGEDLQVLNPSLLFGKDIHTILGEIKAIDVNKKPRSKI